MTTATLFSVQKATLVVCSLEGNKTICSASRPKSVAFPASGKRQSHVCFWSGNCFLRNGIHACISVELLAWFAVFPMRRWSGAVTMWCAFAHMADTITIAHSCQVRMCTLLFGFHFRVGIISSSPFYGLRAWVGILIYLPPWAPGAYRASHHVSFGP